MHRGSPGRALTAYFAVLVPLVALLSWVSISHPQDNTWIYLLMFAPAVSALVSWPISGVRPRFGRFGWQSLVFGLGVVAVVSLGYVVAGLTGIASFAGFFTEPFSLVLSVVSSIGLALGEELGWRGYLLPQLRRVLGYWASNAIVAAVWWAFHVPLILWGPYAPTDRPLGVAILWFTVNIVLFSFTLGALWEVTHDVWMPAIAHGTWNVFIADLIPRSFLGADPWLMGEFGFLPSIPLVVALGLALLLSRGRRPARLDLTPSSRARTGLET